MVISDDRIVEKKVLLVYLINEVKLRAGAGVFSCIFELIKKILELRDLIKIKCNEKNDRTRRFV